MGTTSFPTKDASTRKAPATFQPSSLRKIEDRPPLTIWASPEGKQFELYKIFTSRPLEEQIQIYDFRKQEQPHLVNVVHYEIVNRQFDSSGYLQLEVFTERIPTILSEIQQIPFESGLQILTEALEGFEIIFNHSGPFDIEDSLVGFNTEGKLKVWVNGNWALNSKPISRKKKHVPKNQHQFVEKLIEMVEKHMELSSIYSNWNQARKNMKVWSFGSLKAFVKGFMSKHNLKIECEEKESKATKAQKQSPKKEHLHFKSKSNSPNAKFNSITSSLGIDRNILKPLLSSKQVNKQPLKQKSKERSDFYNPKAPPFLTFKNQNKTNNKSFKHSAFFKRERADSMRVRRNSEQISFTFKTFGKKEHKRMSSNDLEVLKTGRSMMFSHPNVCDQIKESGINYTITVTQSTVIPTFKHNPSLQILRKQFKKFIGSSEDDNKFRTSCTPGDGKKEGNLKESRQFQFKNVNMKKKKKKQESFKVQEPARDSPVSSLNNFAKKTGSKSKQKELRRDEKGSLSPQLQVRCRGKSTSHVPNFGMPATCKESCLASEKMFPKKQRFNLLERDLRLDNMRSTAPTLKPADESMLTEIVRPDASTITIMSKTNRFQQSVLIPDKSQCPLHESQQSKRLNSLKGKSVMTRSINLPSTKQKKEKMIKKEDLRELKLLDQIVFKSNITKNKHEEDLDVSVEISEGGESKKGIVELEDDGE